MRMRIIHFYSSHMSNTQRMNNVGPSIGPCGTSALTVRIFLFSYFNFKLSVWKVIVDCFYYPCWYINAPCQILAKAISTSSCTWNVSRHGQTAEIV